jgi:hypothetical protein
MRYYLAILAIVMISTGCGTMRNTPAQDRAYELVQKCQNVNSNVILQRIDSDGRVWVEMRNGTVGYDEWQQCMAKAAQEQAPTGAAKR